MTFDPQGLSTCARYSFAPNSLHYCGPEKQTDIRAYVISGQNDQGLFEILNRFETLYKYLQLIGTENNIRDPFDRRVVEAYWLGNDLLQKTKYQPLAKLLNDGLQLKKKLTLRQLQSSLSKLDQGVAHHTFHVLNIFRRTGHHAIPQTLETMDNCRISWGRILNQKSSVSWRIKMQKDLAKPDPASQDNLKFKNYSVEIVPLIYQGYRLMLGKPEIRDVLSIALEPKVGDWVSVHWGYVCEVLTLRQVRNLKYYTELAISLANRS